MLRSPQHLAAPQLASSRADAVTAASSPSARFQDGGGGGSGGGRPEAGGLAAVAGPGG